MVPDEVWLAITGSGNWMACPAESDARGLVERWGDPKARVVRFVPACEPVVADAVPPLRPRGV